MQHLSMPFLLYDNRGCFTLTGTQSNPHPISFIPDTWLELIFHTCPSPSSFVCRVWGVSEHKTELMALKALKLVKKSVLYQYYSRTCMPQQIKIFFPDKSEYVLILIMSIPTSPLRPWNKQHTIYMISNRLIWIWSYSPFLLTFHL